TADHLSRAWITQDTPWSLQIIRRISAESSGPRNPGEFTGKPVDGKGMVERGVSWTEPTGWSHPIWHRNRRHPMRQATLLWTLWQALLSHFGSAFTRP